jgi:hypothetical protein
MAQRNETAIQLKMAYRETEQQLYYFLKINRVLKKKEEKIKLKYARN